MCFRHEGDCPNGFFYIYNYLQNMSQSYASFKLIDMQNAQAPASYRLFTSCSPLTQHIYTFTGMFCPAPAKGEPDPKLDWELKFFVRKRGLGLTHCKTSFSSFDSDPSLQADLSQVRCHPSTWWNTLLLTQNIPKQLGRREKAQVNLGIWILDLDSFKRDIFKTLQP